VAASELSEQTTADAAARSLGVSRGTPTDRQNPAMGRQNPAMALAAYQRRGSTDAGGVAVPPLPGTPEAELREKQERLKEVRAFFLFFVYWVIYDYG